MAFSDQWIFDWFCPSFCWTLTLEYLLNLTTQLDNTSLAQPVTKQCFMLFSVCVKQKTH